MWVWNVGDDYVAVTEEHVRNAANGTLNLKVGEESIVASYDPDAQSLGIWHNPSGRVLTEHVDVNGKVGGNGKPLERVSTVKAGCFWCIAATFFPSVRVNPEA